MELFRLAEARKYAGIVIKYEASIGRPGQARISRISIPAV